MKQTIPLKGKPELFRMQGYPLFTSGLLRFGVDLAVDLFKTPGLHISEIPLSERKALSSKLNGLIPEFRRLWLQRNRNDGLSESLAYFKSLNAELIK